MYLGENKHVFCISEVESTGPMRKAIFTPNVSKHKEIIANSVQQTLGHRTISICLQRSKEHKYMSSVTSFGVMQLVWADKKGHWTSRKKKSDARDILAEDAFKKLCLKR